MRILLYFCHVSPCVPFPPLPSLAVPLCAHHTRILGFTSLSPPCSVLEAIFCHSPEEIGWLLSLWWQQVPCAQQLELQGTSEQAKGPLASSEPQDENSSPCPLAVAPWTGCRAEHVATLGLAAELHMWLLSLPCPAHLPSGAPSVQKSPTPRAARGLQTHSLSHCPPQLTASNHVSNFTVNYNVTVEMMNRMRNLSVVGALPVVPQNSSVEFSAQVHVDSAVEALFL